MKLKIVKIGDYVPSRYDKDRGPLVVPFYCVDEKRNFVELKVTGTKPRFWSIDDPFTMEWTESEIHKIKDVKNEGFTLLTNGRKMFTIYVEYPFHVPPVRDLLHEKGIVTAMSDVPYKQVVRIFYGLKSQYIEIPEERTTVNINDISSIEVEE